jgi:hypothetical protein
MRGGVEDLAGSAARIIFDSFVNELDVKSDPLNGGCNVVKNPPSFIFLNGLRIVIPAE